VIGEPVFFRSRRPATVLSDQDGKARRPATTRKPGSLPRNFDSTQLFDGRSLDSHVASRFRIERIGGLFFARLYYPESFRLPAVTAGG
jgi:hypothetical protein